MRSNDSQKIIVVGIPKTMDDAGLSDLFSGFGTVAEAKVVLDAYTNAPRGFGFVTFTAASAMKKAIQEMNKKTVEGRVLNVRQLIPKDKFQAKKQQEESTDSQVRPCWLLRKGKCTKGANCPFSHEIKEGEFGTCFEFVQSGACKRGENCKFLHPSTATDEENDTPQPPVNAKPPAPKEKKEETAPKKRVCFSFQNGRCHRGKKCLFLHEKLAVPEAPVPPKKTKKPEEFEVVSTETTGKKRKREDAVASALSEESSDEEEEKEASPQATKQEEPNTEPAPLKALADHVNKFMAKQTKQQEQKKAPMPKKQTKEEPVKAPAPKKQKKEKIDMGGAFDGLSDEEAPSRPVKKKDRAAMKAHREKLKQERRAKRSAKKEALSRLKEATNE